MTGVNQAEVTDAQLEAFRKLCEEISQTHTATHFSNLPLPTISVQKGSRYAKLVRKDYPDAVGGSVHCFVDLSNGDVLKAASWKAPAKHARSNLNDADGGRSGVNEYGANYIKR